MPAATESTNSARALALLLAGAGTTHLLQPRLFDGLIPRGLPGRPRHWTYGSGIAELAVAATVAAPRTRRTGGLLAACLFVAVFPGNVTMAVDYYSAGKPLPMRWAAVLRLPAQLGLLAWALNVRSTSREPAGDASMTGS